MERLAAAPSTWRILNLHRATRNLHQAYGADAGYFFQNTRLNSAIIVKHTLRDHERAMFNDPPVVATKILVPLDETSLATGAISFFVGERAYPAIMRQSFAINTHSAARDRDARILAKLNEAPTFELFLLRELLGGDEFGIAKEYFQVSLVDDTAIRSYITRELTPLIRIAIDDASQAKINKFIDAIFGAELGTQAADFFASLGLPKHRWGPVVFAWKAALFYETQLAATQKRFDAMLDELRSLKTYGHNEMYPRSFCESHLVNLRAFADRAYERCLDSAQSFNSQRRAEIIHSGRIGDLKGYLEALPQNINGFSGYSAVIDHVLSYWNYRTRGLDAKRMPAEIFCTVAADICAKESHFRQQEMAGGDSFAYID